MFGSIIHFSNEAIAAFNSFILQATPQNTSAETELLKKQLEFLESSNDQIVKSYSAIHQNFGDLLSYLQTSLTIISILFSIGAILGVFTAYKWLRNSIEKEVQQKIADRVGTKIENIETTVEKLAVLKRTKLAYFQPNTDVSRPDEYKMIKTQIQGSSYCTSWESPQLWRSNIVIFDLLNSNLEATDKGSEDAIRLVTQLPTWSMLILYTPTNHSTVFAKLNQYREAQGITSETVDYAIANMKLTLMDRVIGAAYASDALKR